MSEQDDGNPGDDGRPLGNVTATILDRVHTLAHEMGPARLLRHAPELVKKASEGLAVAGRTERDVTRAAAIALEVVRDIASNDVVTIGLEQLGASAERVAERNHASQQVPQHVAIRALVAEGVWRLDVRALLELPEEDDFEITDGQLRTMLAERLGFRIGVSGRWEKISSEKSEPAADSVHGPTGPCTGEAVKSDNSIGDGGQHEPCSDCGELHVRRDDCPHFHECDDPDCATCNPCSCDDPDCSQCHPYDERDAR